VPFHTTDTVPIYAQYDYREFCVYTRNLRSPIIYTRWDILPETKTGRLDIDVRFLHGGELEFDHINPIYKGGSLDLSNVQALCKNCHDKKSYLDYKCSESKRYVLSKYLNEWGVVV
jgi:5-methylcytosine-specific restriction endonuclease McrA